MPNFNTACDRVLGHEGGYVNDPNDPGGETKWGISKRSYPDLEIKFLTRDQAALIYLRDFWTPIHGDEIPFALAFQGFDFAVNSGVQTAIRYMQRALGVVDDGHWGPVTQRAAMGCDECTTVIRLLALRLQFMTLSQRWPYFSRGWASRIANDMLIACTDIHTEER